MASVSSSAPTSRTAAEVCPEGTTPPVVPGAPRACVHSDAAPPGVDIRVKPSVRELAAREGASDAAVAAAQNSGVPTPAAYAAGATVSCDGDGTSGYRTQAMYVVAADTPNRYASVAASIQSWAAGVDDVVNRSAALTGGVRHVRFVTSSNGDGTCSPTVLNVTVPAGSNASFNSTINAVKALGYTSPARKYLMWVDATGYCGIAQTYPYSQADQGNPNNGSYPQFARIDSACWGQSYSVEAHELVHTLGSVMSDAPHHTTNGHCYDESDRMCYDDGSGIAMRQVCASANEALLDCNADDYFSTYPVAGSYLATHWNTANSRFLVGGGDGSSGGDPGSPSVLGVGVAVNNPAIPGLPTQVTATPQVPTGRTASIRWTSSRGDCTFADPTATQTTVTCSAGSANATYVTATITDDTAAKAATKSVLTFTTAPRAVTASWTVDGTTDSTRYDGCTGSHAPLSMQLNDAATGLPVKGLTTSFFQVSGTTTRTVSRVASSAGGLAVSAASPIVTDGLRFYAHAGGVTAWPLQSTVETVVHATGPCPAQLTMTPAATSTGWGDKLVFSGRLTKTVAGATVGAGGERVAFYETVAGVLKPLVLGGASTDRNGEFSVGLPMKLSGTVVARTGATVAYPATQSNAYAISVFGYTTALTAAADRTDVPYQSPVVVSGTLTRTGKYSGATASPAAGLRVTVRYTTTTGAVTSVRAVTAADGHYVATFKPVASGTVTTSFDGLTGGYDPTSSGAVSVHVGDYTTAVTLTSATPTVVAYQGRVTITGSVTRTYGGQTTPASRLRVTVTLTPAVGTPVVSGTTTDSAGNYRAAFYATSSGVVSAKVAGVTGYIDATAAGTPSITVT